MEWRSLWKRGRSFKGALILSLLSLFSHVIFAQQPQNLKKEKMKLGDKTIWVEVARTPEQLSTGLMYRTALDKDAGMLFIFPAKQPLAFWMKNTFIPLSIGFFDDDKKLMEVLEMEPMNSVMQAEVPRYESRRPARYALEMKKNWFSENKVKKGSQLCCFN